MKYCFLVCVLGQCVQLGVYCCETSLCSNCSLCEYVLVFLKSGINFELIFMLAQVEIY